MLDANGLSDSTWNISFASVRGKFDLSGTQVAYNFHNDAELALPYVFHFKYPARLYPR